MTDDLNFAVNQVKGDVGWGWGSGNKKVKSSKDGTEKAK